MTWVTGAILSIGDELMLGQHVDTNGPWLSERLLARGIRTVERVTVPDDSAAISSAIDRLATRADVVVSTGGLGPTADDLTRAALADVLGEALEVDASALSDLEALFRARGRRLLESNRVQAMRPRSARVLRNPHGTAPGLSAVLVRGGRRVRVYALPGPPREMQPMYRDHVEGELPGSGGVIVTRSVHTLGIGESDLASRLGGLMDRDRNPVVGTTASGGSVTCRVRYEGDADGALSALDKAESGIRGVAGEYVVGVDGAEVQSGVVELLASRGELLVTAESCTGGLLGALVTSVAGSSAVYLGGWQVYSNEMKSAALGVSEEALREHGAVSAAVAMSLATGALGAGAVRGCAGVLHSLSITGIAGPGGGAEEKPVGTVFIGRARRGASGAVTSEVRRFAFRGERSHVREVSARFALMMLWCHLRGLEGVRLLWERGE